MTSTTDRDAEFRRLRAIPIAEYAAYLGFTPDKTKSSSTFLVMRSGGDKIIINLARNTYTSRDDGDSGAIFELVKTRTEHSSWKSIFMELRRFEGIPEIERKVVVPEKRTKAAPVENFPKTWASFSTYNPAEDGYLQSRAIPVSVIDAFKQWIRTDKRNHGNVCFVHTTERLEVVGWEIKNRLANGNTWTSFANGGTKLLWRCEVRHLSRKIRIIIGESAIDVLSWAAVNRDEQGRVPWGLYLSTGGSFGPDARDAVRQILVDNPDADVITAFDDDAQGRKFTAQVEDMAPGRVIRAIPELGKDFNEFLQTLQEFGDARAAE